MKDGSCDRTRTGGSSRRVEGFCGLVLGSFVCCPSGICQNFADYVSSRVARWNGGGWCRCDA